jgi:leucyl aminopeptidase
MKTTFQSTLKLDTTGGLLALAISDEAPSSLPSALSDAFGANLEGSLGDAEFKAKAGSSFSLRITGQIGAKWLLLVGAGDQSANSYRQAAGAVGAFARRHGLEQVQFALGEYDKNGEKEILRAVAEGLEEGNYSFDQYQLPAKKKSPIAEVTLVTGKADGFEQGFAHAQGQKLARDLVNGTPEIVTPQYLADIAEGLTSDQLTVQIWDAEKLKAEGMNGIEAVGRGSVNPPFFVHMTWTPKCKPSGRVAIVGKGVTFDAGGLSIKPSGGMLTMKSDMGGAAVVLGSMAALSSSDVSVVVEGIFAAAENMLGGEAYKLGDILTMSNGKTVEIHNTDAEGRLLLADSLVYADRLGCDAVVDFATLTGAQVVALGEKYTALYTSDDSFAESWTSNADKAGEGLWRMPLEEEYKSMLKGDWSTLKNVGGRAAGSITAALFLSEFVVDTTWAHFDIAGPSFLSKPRGHVAKGGTGAMVRTTLRWLESL